jgi:SAM-dependent methyltransferase
MVPPRRDIDYIGGHDFLAIGRELARIVIEQGGLKSDERLIDAGCGFGRVAVALTDYLHGGQYEGFDLSRRAIDWCRREIGGRYPNFRFTHADVFSQHYNPSGRVKPEDFTFPYADASADVVLAVSLFTRLPLPHVATQRRRRGCFAPEEDSSERTFCSMKRAEG